MSDRKLLAAREGLIDDWNAVFARNHSVKLDVQFTKIKLEGK